MPKLDIFILERSVFFQLTDRVFCLLVCKFNGKMFFQSEIIVLQDRKSLW